MSFLNPSTSCPASQCHEVLQICWHNSVTNLVTSCQQIPVDRLVNGSLFESLTLAEMKLFILACISLMSIAYVFKLIFDMLLRS